MHNIRKKNYLILRKLSDWQMDGQTDESDFTGRYPTNVERLITKAILYTLIDCIFLCLM